jgi:general secretion pathway protein I
MHIVPTTHSQHHSKGFTLIEALVALTIVAIGLIAALKAVGHIGLQQNELKYRLLAQWSADQIAQELRLRNAFPAIGTFELDCPQGKQAWRCIVNVQTTANINFRRIEIRVVHPQTPSQFQARLLMFLAKKN